MKKLEKPKYMVGYVFKKCISSINDEILKDKLKLCNNELVEDEKNYIDMGEKHNLYSIGPKSVVNKNVTVSEMKKVYTYRMVDKKQPGRIIYNNILNSTGKCPFCGQRDVSTLDHFLPKSKYPTYVVTPINLIPSCKDCNDYKDTYFASSEEEELFHPYFDCIDDDVWLTAKVVKKNNGPVVLYNITMPLGCTDIVKEKRLKRHFEILHLGLLYSIEAGSEMDKIDWELRDVITSCGEIGLKEHLERRQLSYSHVDKNCWQAAMYSALIDSNWFINVWLKKK